MYSKTRKSMSIALASAMLLSSSAGVMAAKHEAPGKGRPPHVAEKIEAKKDSKAEIKASKREALLMKRASILKKYSDDDIKGLKKAEETISSFISDDDKILPFDSIVSRRDIKFDAPPVIKSGRTLIPVRAISEGFKASVDWNEEAREVTIEKDGLTIVIKIDSNTVCVNGEEQEIDSEAKIMSGRTYVPLRFIAERLGIKVSWDEESETVELDEDLAELKEELTDDIDDLREELEEKKAELKEKMAETDSDDSDDIEELESEISELEGKLAENEAEVQKLESEIAEAEEVDYADDSDDASDSDDAESIES